MASALLVGESEVLHNTRHKGFDVIHSTSYGTDGLFLVQALERQGHDVAWMKTEDVARSFPTRPDKLDEFDVVILSDVGSNSLLLHPDVLSKGIAVPNRLRLLRDWVAGGKGLMMCGGWLSFGGLHGAGMYHQTAVEEALPVEIVPYDDRVESPQGVSPRVAFPEHPVVDGLNGDWPVLLGYNRVQPSPGAEVVVEVEGDPLLVTGQFGQGRSIAWTSDVVPHWASPEFIEWEGYGPLFSNMVSWLAQR